jgi:1-acyl-sn-glycerol-3-phosphate acyltransferase
VFARLLLWFLLRALLGAGLLAAGLKLDELAGFPPLPPAPGIAALVMLLGATALLRCVHELLKADASGLVESVPYQVMRHPLSAGFQALLLGAALALASPGGLLACGPLAFLLWAAHARFLEEPALLRRFPAQYRRYRRGTGFLIPSIYFWSLHLTSVFYRLWCGLQLRGLEQVPRHGPFFMIALHRNYMDPYFMAFRLRRRVHYIATAVLFRQWLGRLYFKGLGCIPLVRGRADLRPMMAAFRLLGSGGAVGMYPEGARSWYGETACEPSVFRLLEMPRVPIVTVEVYGAFEQQPRFSRRLRRSRLRLRYEVHPPRGAHRLLQELLARERQRDARLRSLRRRLPARGAEQLVYLCPQCRVPFRCRGHDDGRIVCSACGAVFTLLEGKGLESPAGVWSLVELEKLNLSWVRSLQPAGLRLGGLLLGRTGLRCRRAGKARLRRGALVLGENALTVEQERAAALLIAYGDVESVLVEGNRKLELSYRSEGRQGFLVFRPPSRYVVFLQHFLRLRAFANPYARYRGSSRQELEPARRAGPGRAFVAGAQRTTV